MSTRLLALLVLSLASSSAFAAQERDVERWFTREAIPQVLQQLTEYPRFKGETIMLAVLDRSSPAVTSNALALDLRDRLLSAVVETPGINVAWRQSGADRHAGTADCVRDDAHYIIGIELNPQHDNRYKVSVRALDVEDRSWVNGFGADWSGSFSASQRHAARDTKTDMTFLGARDVPFAADQGDLLAKHLAHELSCALHRETSGDYIVPADFQAADTIGLDDTVELVSNNIAANDAIELTNDPALANADISGKAHQIDGSLFQYWLSVTPRGEDSELTSLTVSAYVLRNDTAYARNDYVVPARTLVAMPTSQRGSLIGMRAFTDDAVVFFVQHQPYFGLVRLDNGICRDRTMAKVVRAGDPVQFPVNDAHSNSSEMMRTDSWYANPVRDTYYAIAISDERLARQVANHLDRLPIRCGAAARPGLKGSALHDWLEEFSILASSAEQFIDWQAIEIKDVL